MTDTKDRPPTGKGRNPTEVGKGGVKDSANLPAATPAHAPALEWWPVDRPVPYARNPRRNDGAVDALAASIREFGFRSPVLVDAAGVVIAGHTRLKAARKLGLREVPVLVCADLPPEKVAALRLADNKTAELAEWDTPALDAELAELAEAGVDMEQFGFLSVSPDDFGTEFGLPTGGVTDCSVSLVVSPEQRQIILDAIEALGGEYGETYGNKQKNGNALAAICRAFLESREVDRGEV